MKLSVVIPARNEFPNCVHSFYSIVHALESEGFTYKDYEIIIVDNCSDDRRFPQRGTGGTIDYLQTRGAYFNRILRVCRFPIAGNHAARNYGAQIARGEYVFFSDAHMAYRPGFFTKMIKAQQESGGLVHGAVQWMGAYPPHEHGMGYGYSIKLGEEWKMTWNNYKVSDKFFAVPGQGHWGVMVNKKQFFQFGGYPEVHRTYGGGEVFIDCLWWMLGSCVVVEPNAVGYHLASGRGYSYHHDDYIHNVFNCSYALGCDDWLERMYINYLRKSNKQVLDKMLLEAKQEMAKRRAKIEKKRKYSFNDLLTKRPWDSWNEEKRKTHFSAMSIFHWSWLEIMQSAPEQAKEAYKNSQHQQQLGEFIETELKDYIYRAPQYEKKYGLETLINWRKGIYA